MAGNEKTGKPWTEGAAAALTVLFAVLTVLAGLSLTHRTAAGEGSLILGDGGRAMILVPYPRR